MTHDDAFLHAIIENPEDDTPRLVYADWLDEHGQPERAEFIRLQCELARLPQGDPRWEELAMRERGMLERHARDWLVQDWPLAQGPPSPDTFRRGFVSRLSLVGQSLGDDGLRQLALCPRLALLTALDLRKNGIGEDGLSALAQSPYAAGLAFLDLRDNGFPLESLHLLASSPRLPRLCWLPVELATYENWPHAPEPDLVLGEAGMALMREHEQLADQIRGWFRRHGKEVSIRTPRPERSPP